MSLVVCEEISNVFDTLDKSSFNKFGRFDIFNSWTQSALQAERNVECNCMIITKNTVSYIS